MRVLVLALAAATLSCDMPWAVELEQPLLEVPAEYRTWFAEVSACMGRPTDLARFERIRWYTAPLIEHRDTGQRALGLWTEPHKIVVQRDFAGF